VFGLSDMLHVHVHHNLYLFSNISENIGEIRENFITFL